MTANDKPAFLAAIQASKKANGGSLAGFTFPPAQGDIETDEAIPAETPVVEDTVEEAEASETAEAEPARRGLFDGIRRTFGLPTPAKPTTERSAPTANPARKTPATPVTTSKNSTRSFPSPSASGDTAAPFDLMEDEDEAALGAGKVCPKPLIINPKGPFADMSVPDCPIEGCCMPCPFYHTLFPPKRVRRIEILLTFFNLISVPFTVITMYLVASRPGAFKSTKLLTVIFSLGNVMLMQAVEGLLLASHHGGHGYMCDGVAESAKNNTTCTIEGLFLINSNTGSNGFC